MNEICEDITLKLHLSHNLLFSQESEGSILLEGYIEALKANHIYLPSSQCVEIC